MDINFPLWLVILSFVTGVIYLLDIIVLAPKRKKRIKAFDVADSFIDKQHDEIRDKLNQEPLVVDYAKALFPVFFLVLIIRSFIAEPFTIPSESMLPTLEVGDFIVVSKFSYGLRLPVIGTKIIDFGEPKRGDVMVFKSPPEPNKNFIKRVVGLPGDKIVYRNKRLFVNDVAIEETLLPEEHSAYQGAHIFEADLAGAKHLMQKHTQSKSRSFPIDTWVIDEGHYFVMGDNRDNSNDSRFWGTVPDDMIVGKAYAIWIHKRPGFNLPSFVRNGVIQ